jgi:hypothetical protein
MVEQYRVSNRGWQVNWGKSFPGGRGLVEYVNIKLKEPRDITLYLGQPDTQMFQFPAAPNYNISVGSGGTSFNYLVGSDDSGNTVGVASSVRGNVLHFVCSELYVRGDTSNILFATPEQVAAMRFGAQAGLGRPSNFQRQHAEQRTANGDAEVGFNLTPWSTHVRFDISAFTGGGGVAPNANPIDGFTVRFENISPLGTTTITGELPIAGFLQPGGVPIPPGANAVTLTTFGGGGPPPGGPPAGATYTMLLTETLVY